MNQCKVAFNIVITSTLTNPLLSNPAMPMPELTDSYAYLRCLHIENDWRHNKELFTNKCRPTVSLRQFIPPGDFFVVIYPGDYPRWSPSVIFPGWFSSVIPPVISRHPLTWPGFTCPWVHSVASLEFIHLFISLPITWIESSTQVICK